MKQEFEIVEEWLPFEIHPDTPLEGVLWKDYFPGMNPEAFFRQLDERGRKMGVRFGPQPLMSNSRLAMQGGEFAKEHGRYDAYHEAVFRAFFTECKDIGDQEVILDLAKVVGLDVVACRKALEDGIYMPRLHEASRKAKMSGFSAAPTFVIAGYGSLSGAQPIEQFRKILRGVEKGTIPEPLATVN